MNIAVNLLLVVILCGSTSSCTTSPPASSESYEIATTDFNDTGETLYWWYARYRITWPPESEPDFSVDLLIANTMIKPTLQKYRENIKYWRFHRRAARDTAGHTFSFIFYASKGLAKEIYSELQSHRLLPELKQGNIIQELKTDDPENNSRIDVTATSDRNWPEEIQKSWPAYIMGVCSMWLQLIDQETEDNLQNPEIDQLLDQYRTANDNITKLWHAEAQHAFLHHLNAIFGYEPALIQKAIRF